MLKNFFTSGILFPKILFIQKFYVYTKLYIITSPLDEGEVKSKRRPAKTLVFDLESYEYVVFLLHHKTYVYGYEYGIK